MPSISVRVTEEEKEKLSKKGELSENVRKAIKMFLSNSEEQEVLDRLSRLQEKHRVLTSPDDIVRMIREERQA